MNDFPLSYSINGCALTISWNDIEKADGYYLMAKDSYSVYSIINDVDKLFCDINLVACTNYYGFVVAAYIISNNEKIIIAQSEEIQPERINQTDMNIQAIQSYSGITLSWIDTNTDRGRYYIFKKYGSTYSVIKYTEDTQVTLNDVKKDDSFIIASVRNNGKTEITALSEEYVYSELNDLPKNQKKVSVIVPIYNNERFIPRCIDSILMSTLKNIELILVDDGSSDNSPQIVDWYAKHYPDQIVAIHQKNAGAAAARNSGISCAKGEYISFVDSDDMIHPRMLELLYNDAVSLDCEIAACQYFKHSAKNGKILRYRLPCAAHTAYDTVEMLKVIYSEGFGTVAIWHKIYKAELIKQRPIPEIKYEDVAWTPYIISHAKRFCFVPIPLYCWDRRVEYTKSTLSNIFSDMEKNEKFENRKCAFDYYLQNGNPDKIECLCYVAIKRIIQCAEKFPKTGIENPYHNYIYELNQKFDLLNNSFIENDKEYFQKLSQILVIQHT